MYWVPIDIDIVRFQIGGICTLTSFLRDHLGYRGRCEIEILYHFEPTQQTFRIKIFVQRFEEASVFL